MHYFAGKVLPLHICRLSGDPKRIDSSYNGTVRERRFYHYEIGFSGDCIHSRPQRLHGGAGVRHHRRFQCHDPKAAEAAGADRAVKYRSDRQGTQFICEQIGDAICQMRACMDLRADWKSRIEADGRKRK